MPDMLGSNNNQVFWHSFSFTLEEDGGYDPGGGEQKDFDML